MARVDTTRLAGIEAASKKKPKASTKAATKTKPPTNNAEMIAQANALIKKLQDNVEKTQQSAIEIGAINPSVIKKAESESNAEFLTRKTATYKAVPQPTLTDEQIAQGFTVQFVRTGIEVEG